MIFQKYLESIIRTSKSDTSVSIYPISDYNLEGLKILIDNCIRMGSENNSNVEIATVSPALWLGQILDKHWNKISYVTSLPTFEVLKFDQDQGIIKKTYRCDTATFDNEGDIDDFFNKNKFKKLVIFSITKQVRLDTLQSQYNIRYSDITEKYEERDIKINSILDGTNNQ
jgi:hypothetical protein